ncbi:MAG TPA: hypothetical protein VEI50_04020 [Nitrospiraceae bacterium]|nr:hypothetical protein [Nitrospiraceae bacterium]
MNHSHPVDVVAELTLPFLGNRTYLHGTTLFESMRSHLSSDGPITFKIARRIESNRVRISLVTDLVQQKDEWAASLVFRSAKGPQILVAQPLELLPPIERQAYDESVIISRATGGKNELWFEGPSPFTLIATLIPMFKVLLKREHPMNVPGQWMFTRLDLEGHPEKQGRLGLRLDAVLGSVLARSVILRDHVSCGHLYYSWVA